MQLLTRNRAKEKKGISQFTTFSRIIKPLQVGGLQCTCAPRCKADETMSVQNQSWLGERTGCIGWLAVDFNGNEISLCSKSLMEHI